MLTKPKSGSILTALGCEDILRIRYKGKSFHNQQRRAAELKLIVFSTRTILEALRVFSVIDCCILRYTCGAIHPEKGTRWSTLTCSLGLSLFAKLRREISGYVPVRGRNKRTSRKHLPAVNNSLCLEVQIITFSSHS